ncbi:MAG: DegT/DnrJ/EryC1/StrS aminotransferase family protein, partial [Candidatus Omnitrophica bacterium]|nr:DegT/DnrJ/EryC1/StrS aminotransferase family protein [Candidatus Omnitrophota bacterium]
MLNKIYARQSPNITLSDLKALWKVLRVGQVSYGPMVEEFEKQFAAYVGVRSACMVNMGRTAEFVALKGLNFKSGDEIIMPSYNFPIVPIVVKMLGLKPVFVDVEEDTFNINPLHIEA